MPTSSSQISSVTFPVDNGLRLPASQQQAPAAALRIAHVAPQLDVGGLERLLVEFGRHLDRKQFELQFVSLGERGTLAGELENLGWPVTALQMRPGLRPWTIWRMARHFRHYRVDVVHTHNNKSLFYAAPAARLVGIQHILHTRHGQSYYRSRNELIAFRYASRLAKFVVCVSNDSAKLCRQEGISVDKILTIPNAVDTTRFRYCGPQPRGPLMMIGRLSEEKNPMLLLRAMAIALREDSGLRLEIVGDGPCRAELETATRELGLVDHVKFAGEVSGIDRLLPKSSVFVLPSLTEGISLTLLEAMAVGIPTVATNVGGSTEVVLDQVTGRLVPSNDAEELAAAILQIWRDPENARLMGRAGRQRVMERYDMRRMIDQYQDLYRGVWPNPAKR